MGTVYWMVAAASVVGLIGMNASDIRRYIRIRRM